MRNTHNIQILKYLLEHREGITPAECKHHIGSMVLFARVHEIKNKLGVALESEYVKVRTRDGYARVKRYWIHPHDVKRVKKIVSEAHA